VPLLGPLPFAPHLPWIQPRQLIHLVPTDPELVLAIAGPRWMWPINSSLEWH
jgi:hypothetical protein